MEPIRATFQFRWLGPMGRHPYGYVMTVADLSVDASERAILNGMYMGRSRDEAKASLEQLNSRREALGLRPFRV